MAKAKWTVRLLKKPKVNDFRSDYFPRSFALKRDAMELVREVEGKGGEAVCEKVEDKQNSRPTKSSKTATRTHQATSTSQAQTSPGSSITESGEVGQSPDPTTALNASSQSNGEPAQSAEAEQCLPFVQNPNRQPKVETENHGGNQQPKSTRSLPKQDSETGTALSETSTHPLSPADAAAEPVAHREKQNMPWLAPSPQLSELKQTLAKRSSDVAPHVEVRALAGTGKTTTVIEGMKKVKGLAPSITPSEQQAEVWKQMCLGKHDSVRLCAFNTTITDEMKSRLAKSGLDKLGCEARGIHSLGFGAVTKAFGRLEPTKFAMLDIISDLLGADYRQLKKDPGMVSVLNATDELVSLCKQNLLDPTPENLDRLASHYDVEINGGRNQVYDLVPEVLQRAKLPQGKLAFDDMVWLPVVLNLPIYRTDVAIVDECQDLSRMQQELIYKAGHRVIMVGDANQALYGFAGADVQSMARMSQFLASSSSGLVVLPLTVTRRCGKAIVEEARKIVPEFEAHESNHPGVVRNALYPLKPKSGNYWTQGGAGERKWEETYCAEVRGGDMVLCRVNAPLVSNCFRFLKRNIKANILGRNIGQGLISMIDKSRAQTIDQLVGWIDDWQAKELSKESAKRFPSEQRIIAVQDKHDCLLCFTEGCNQVSEVTQKINTIFTDDKDCPGVRLSSIHKAKGLEAKRVYLLEPDGATVPHPMAKTAWQVQQEWNCRYVAITRAREELVYVS